MKKLTMCLVILMLLLLTGCGTKECYTCGESLKDGGYTVFGNDYCENCFMYDLGLDK